MTWHRLCDYCERKDTSCVHEAMHKYRCKNYVNKRIGAFHSQTQPLALVDEALTQVS